MRNIIKKFHFNQLIVYTFSMVWMTFLLMVTILLLLPYLDARFYSNLKDDEIAAYQKKLISAMRTDQINRILTGTPVLPLNNFESYRLLLIDKNNNVFGTLNSEQDYVHLFVDIADEPTKLVRHVFRDKQFIGPFSVYLNANDYYHLYFIENINPRKEILNFIFDHPWYLLMLLILVTTPLFWWFSRTLIRPIENLRRSANTMATGDFKIDKSLTTQGPIELRQVGKSFNHMAQAISDLLSNQQNLLSSISHELRTPLTRLQLSISLLRRKVGESQEVERIEKEIDEMNKMINDLLTLSRNQMNSHVEREVFNLPKLWQDVVADAQFEAEQKNIELQLNIEIEKLENLVINANLRLLKSAIENVIRNALKYTKDKILITIFLEEEEEEEEEELVIRVEDNGAGLAESEFKKIFQPFYRVDEARTRETGGVGLGLAIVSGVVQEHQGEVWAEKSKLGGLAVSIRLPLWIEV